MSSGIPVKPADPPGNVVRQLMAEIDEVTKDMPTVHEPGDITLNADQIKFVTHCEKVAKQRGFRDGIEKAVEVVTGLRDKWCKPSGTKEEEAAWDQCQRIYSALRALSPDDGTVRVPREATHEMLEAGAEVLDRLSLLGFREQAETAYRAMIAEVK